MESSDLPQRSLLSYADHAGPVYFTPHRVLRAVPAEAEGRMRALLESGLPDALAARGLMPATRVSAETLPGSRYVIEHPRLPLVTYPYEWSFEMLRAAARCVLETNLLANDFGYELGDCQPFNVVFDGPHPRYVDLGSLELRRPGLADWGAFETFVRSYEYPLRIWEDGGEFIARRLLAASEQMSHADYGIYRWPWVRGGAARYYQKGCHYWFRYRQLARVPPERIEMRLPRLLRGAMHRTIQSGLLPWQRVDLRKMQRWVAARRRRGPRGSWGDYQGGRAAFVDTPRFQRVAAIVASQGLDSIVELGGNQGYFCDLLLESGAVRTALCTDADETAIDQAYLRAIRAGTGLRTAVLDFVNPMASPAGDPPPVRLRCDGVVALALTHHLLLSQRIPVERLLQTIARYARRFAAVEFMPLGLWDGTKAPPVPSWYRLEWFREHFAREFEITHDESLEVNRHLFCGRPRKGADSSA